MLLTNEKQVLIVGLGLIGGSYARALTGQGYRVTAIDKNESSIRYALHERIIAAGSTEVDAAMVGAADIVVFALYPHVFVEWIREYQHLFKSGALITDVTGVKASVVYEVQDVLREDVEYIAAHPMAGREVYGVENSDRRIFYGANYIVVPTEQNTAPAVELCRDLGEVLGFARISVLSPEEHDEMIGFVSQLTHCIAVSLMTCSDNRHLVNYTGDSFRDLTRIARINDAMWSELFMLNREPLLRQMDTFMEEFSALRDIIADGDTDTLREKMRLSTERRALFDK